MLKNVLVKSIIVDAFLDVDFVSVKSIIVDAFLAEICCSEKYNCGRVFVCRYSSDARQRRRHSQVLEESVNGGKVSFTLPYILSDFSSNNNIINGRLIQLAPLVYIFQTPTIITLLYLVFPGKG